MSIDAQLEAIVGAAGLSELRALPGVPVAAPADEAQAAALVALARTDHLPFALCGNGSKLGWSLLVQPPRFLLSTRRLTGLVEFEPGDGVLTARAGTTLAELQAQTAPHGLAITPDVARPSAATLGGVIGAGQSGPDRLANGPTRLHVLGTRTLQLDGATTKSGGKLVKNVSGYDVHRLLTGGCGSLALVLEASLRLALAPEATLVLSQPYDDLEPALAAAQAVRAARVSPRSITLESPAGATACRLHVVLAGRAAHVQLERERLDAALPGAEVTGGDAARHLTAELRDLEPDGRERLALRLAASPTQLRAVARELFDALPEAHDARLVAQPGVANLDLEFAGPAEASHRQAWAEPLPRLRAALRPLGAQVHLRLPRPAGIELVDRDADPVRVALQERLRATFDPDGLLCTRPALGGLR